MRDSRAKIIHEKETLGELAAVVPEEGRTTMLTASGQGPPRLAGRELTRGVANNFIREYDSYVADLEYGGVVGGVTQKTAPIGQLLDAGQRQALAPRYFGRGKQLSEGQLRKGPM